MAYSIYIKLMFTTAGCFENAILLQLPGFTFASSFPYSNCVILVKSKFLSLCKTNKQTIVRGEASLLHGLQRLRIRSRRLPVA